MRIDPREHEMPQALEYASDDIRNDPVVTLPVVESCWWAATSSQVTCEVDKYEDRTNKALEFLGQEVRRDEEIAIAFFSASLHSDHFFAESGQLQLQAALRQNALAFESQPRVARNLGKCDSSGLQLLSHLPSLSWHHGITLLGHSVSV